MFFLDSVIYKRRCTIINNQKYKTKDAMKNYTQNWKMNHKIMVKKS